MRLFAALRPPPEIARSAHRAVRSAVESVAAVEPALRGVRLASEQQLHLTLAFYGDVSDDRVPELAGRLERAAQRSEPVEMALVGAGAFPRRSAASVLWLGLAAEPTTGLTRLAERTQAAGRRVGLAVEQRRWRAHLTVGRIRPAADVRAVVERLSSYRSALWTAAELELVRSRLGPQVEHEVIGRWPLGRADG